MKSQKIIFPLLLAILASSCANNDEFKSDIKKDVKPSFLSQSTDISNKAPTDQWWLEFNDELLNRLIDLGLKNNRDIQIANQSIVTSRQLNNVDATKLFPTGTAGISRQRFASPGFGPSGVKYDLFQATFDASWELDFLGKNLDRYKAGKLRFLKEAQLYKANSLRITSEIAQNYFALKATQKQIANLEKIHALYSDITQIVTKKEELGIASKSLIHQSGIDQNSAEVSLLEVKTNEKILTYKLAVLVGVTPEEIGDILKPAKQKNIFDYNSGIVPVGLKSDVLKRRPDIIAAEYEIDAALYDKSAQFKEFFPSFNLTARIGGGATSLGDVLKDSTNVKDIRGGVTVPIFSVGQLLAEYKISKSKAKIAVLDYEKTVLTALQDCESQLVRYINSLAIENNSKASLQASNNILQIDQNKKRLGIISKEDVKKSEISALMSENQMAQRKSETLSNLVALHKAIGGGFENYEMHFEKDGVQFVENKNQSKNDQKKSQ